MSHLIIKNGTVNARNVNTHKAMNGVEVNIFENKDTSPFLLDLYMRRFSGGESKKIQAFHAVLTPEQAVEIALELLDQARQCEGRRSNPTFAKYTQANGGDPHA